MLDREKSIDAVLCATPVTWRDFWVFGTGAMGDFGCHDLDAACWALDLHAPTSVAARPAGCTDAEIAPHGEICYYTFPARGKNPPVKVTWYDGGLQPPCPAELGPRWTLPGRGVLFIGDKGKMLCGGAGGAPRLLPYEIRPTTKSRPSRCRARTGIIETSATPAKAALRRARISSTVRG